MYIYIYTNICNYIYIYMMWIQKTTHSNAVFLSHVILVFCVITVSGIIYLANVFSET